VFSLPGQVREWRLTKPLDGACLFFTREFVADTFSDSRFLDQFAFFSAARPSASIRLSARERRAFGTHFTAMQRELAERRADASQLLRAHLYQLLTLLNRWYAEQHGELSGMAPTGFVERFRKLIERDFSRHRRVADYAAELGVTPGHLNALCRLQTQRSAGDLMRSRIVLEARRQLLYTQDSAAQIGERLGFNDPAYFTRFFRREVGQIPSGFRARRAS
jgi:AraC-like DNA-binding protein